MNLTILEDFGGSLPKFFEDEPYSVLCDSEEMIVAVFALVDKRARHGGALSSSGLAAHILPQARGQALGS